MDFNLGNPERSPVVQRPNIVTAPPTGNGTPIRQFFSSPPSQS
jgi:hypothetical protein